MRARLGLRTRLQLSVIGAVALVLVGLVVVFNFVLAQRLSDEADNALYARTSAALASLHFADLARRVHCQLKLLIIFL